MILYKKCIVCKARFDNKRKDGNFLSPKQFAKSKYCSLKCSPHNYWLGKKNIQHSDFMKQWIKNHGHPLKGKKMSLKSKEKMSQSRIKGIKKGYIKSWNKGMKYFLNEKSHNWKGDKVGYYGLHNWVNSRLGKPKICFHCQTTTARKFEWCNISHKYKRELSDWIRLCTKCHRNYDYGNLKLRTI